jgi:hypothetical protein
MMAHRFKQAAFVFAARGSERFGRTGWLGLALCAVAAVWFAQVWGQRQQPLPTGPTEPVLSAPAVAASSPVTPGVAVTLARQDEQALILTQIQQVAVSQGLAWTAADYKLVPAGESIPMSLEVRCTLKGAYPRLRATLAQWLRQVPGLAIRDLSLSRPSSEVVDVEAKLQLVVFMRSETPEARP